jgi:uncharacterized protein YraI
MTPVPAMHYSSLKTLFPGLALLALMIGADAAWADADGPDYYRVTKVAKGDVLHMRSAPNSRAPKVGKIPPGGKCVRNLGCKGGLSFQEFTQLSKTEREQRLKQNPRWCKVEYQGATGWVAGRYLTEGGCP